MGDQPIDSFNAEVANALKESNVDVTTESSTVDEETQPEQDVNPESSPEVEEGDQLEGTAESPGQEQNSDPNSKANQRIRQLLAQNKSLEEKAVKMTELEKQLGEVQKFVNENSEILEIAEVFATNPDLLDRFKTFMEQGKSVSEEDAYANLDPVIAKELKESKKARDVLQRMEQRERQREIDEKRAQEKRSRIESAQNKFSKMDSEFEELCKSSKIDSVEEKQILTHQIFLAAMTEFAPELYEQLFMEAVSKIPEGYLMEAFQKHAPTIQKLKSSVKKSLNVPVMPASGSRTGVPAIKTGFASTKELNDDLAMELKKMNS